MTEVERSSPAKPQRSAGRTIARNTLFGVVTQLTLKVASFLFNVFIVRSLGGDAFGQYSIVTAWATLFSVIGDLGVVQYVTREIARDPGKTRQLFWDAVVLRFILAIITSAITILGAMAFTPYSPEIILGIAIFTSTYFLQALIAPFNSVLTGNERVDLTAVVNTAMQVLFMILAGIFLVLRLSFLWVILAGPLTLPLVMGIQYWMLRRNNLGPPQFRINRDMWLSIIKAGLPFAFIQLSLSFAFRADTIILSSRGVSNEAVGWYNVAYTLVLTFLGISTSFNNAILPTLAREHALDPDAIRPWYYRSVKIMLAIGLPVAVGGMLLSGDIVRLLYQPEIAPAAIVLAIMFWDIPVVMYHSFCGNMTTSMRRERGAARIYGSLGIVNILLNLLLIPQFGIIGAAFATVLTDLIGAAQFYFLFRHELGAGLGLRRLVRLGIAAGIMGLLILSLSGLHLVLVVPIAGIAYLLMIWFAGAFTPEERALIMRLVNRLLPRRRQVAI